MLVAEKQNIERMREAVLAQEEMIVRAARVNRDVFKEFVLMDDTGKSIRQAAIHEEWTRHIVRCIKDKKYPAILAPMGHGKTEQMVIGEVLYMIGRYPNLRIKIVCNTDQNARLRIGSIRKYIEESARFKLVFPDAVPDYSGKWNDHQLFLQREGFGKDPSIEAWGIFSQGAGGRADVLVFDDPCDEKNTLLEPQSRVRVISVVQQTWMSRLEEHKRVADYAPVFWIATVYHEKDASCVFAMKNPEFNALVMGINDTDTMIDCRRNTTAGDTVSYSIPLWGAKWDHEALVRRRATMGPRAYARGMQNRPWSDGDIVLPSFKDCCDYSVSPWDLWNRGNPDWRVIAGVDPAGERRKGFAVFVGAVNKKTRQRLPLDIRIGEWNGRAAIDQCSDIQRMYDPEFFMVENNNTQEIFINWLREAGEPGIRVVPFNTGGNKADPNTGLPSLDIEFAAGMWLVALKDHDHRNIPDCECAWCRWIKETTLYPAYGSSDLLMASWFFREGDRGGSSIEELLDSIQGAGKRGGASELGNMEIPMDMKPDSLRVLKSNSGSAFEKMAGW